MAELESLGTAAPVESIKGTDNGLTDWSPDSIGKASPEDLEIIDGEDGVVSEDEDGSEDTPTLDKEKKEEKTEEAKPEAKAEEKKDTVDYKSEFEKLKGQVEQILTDPEMFKKLINLPQNAHLKTALQGQAPQEPTAPTFDEAEFGDPDELAEMVLTDPIKYTHHVAKMAYDKAMAKVDEVMKPMMQYNDAMKNIQLKESTDKAINDFKNTHSEGELKELVGKVMTPGSAEEARVVNAMNTKNMTLDEAFEFTFRKEIADAKIANIAKSKQRASLGAPAASATAASKGKPLSLREKIFKNLEATD